MSFTDEFELERLKRRQFLKVAGGTTLGAAMLLAGCGGSSGGSSLNSNGSAAIEFLTVHKINSIQQTSLNQQVQLLAGQGALPVLYNGQLLALPFELNIEGFWYNKKIFAQNGLQPPQTFDELGQIAASLQQKGIQPFASSGVQGWPITRLIGNYLFRKLGPDALAKVKNGQAKLTDPSYVEAAQAVANLGKQGYFGKGVATLDYAPAQDLFLQGKAAMYYMGSWAVRDFETSSNKIGADNIGFFQFPNVTGGVGNSNQTPMNCGQTTSVNKQKYNATVGQWLAYVAKNYGAVSLQKQGVVSGFVVHNKPANLPPLTSLVLDHISKVSQPVLWFEAVFPAKASNLSQQDAAPLVTGALAPSGFMTAVQGGV